MQTITSRQDAEAYVTEAIEATGVAARDEYDIEAILDHYWDTYTGWARMEGEEPEGFWAVVERYAR